MAEEGAQVFSRWEPLVQIFRDPDFDPVLDGTFSFNPNIMRNHYDRLLWHELYCRFMEWEECIYQCTFKLTVRWSIVSKPGTRSGLNWEFIILDRMAIPIQQYKGLAYSLMDLDLKEESHSFRVGIMWLIRNYWPKGDQVLEGIS